MTTEHAGSAAAPPYAASAGYPMRGKETISDEQVPMVGGPKDGETYRWTTARTLLIPDARDMKQKVTADGVVTIFGEHTYQLNCYAKDGQKEWRWEYVGYEPPK